MNQSIIFSDNEYYNLGLEQVEFQAQCQGRLIRCAIHWSILIKLSEENIPPAQANEKAALAFFETARFDIEDLAETLINQQAFNDDGNIIISHC
ncbi:MAG: DUF1488 domain-containing protein [Psychromonas sp.]